MPDLTKPLKWTEAKPDELKMLRALQGNILKGHGRHFTANIFLQFGDDQLKSRRLLRELANHHVTDAHSQLLAARAFKDCGKSGGDFCHVAISAVGYEALGIDAGVHNDADFLGGMRSQESRDALADPDLQFWDPPFRASLHAVVLAAGESQSSCAKLTLTLKALITEHGASVIHTQHGKQLFNTAGEGIEHFGYVDGRSQPLMLVEDIQHEAEIAGTAFWDPSFELGTALVADPGMAGQPESDYSFGSYFVFRKLEQNVRGFKRREQQIAPAGVNRELRGAMLVGRFEDGTPVTTSSIARGNKPPNDFNYDGDTGSRCPFHSHIRKTNPRGSGGGEPEEAERRHLMARRGITYEDVARSVHPDELPEAENLDEFDENVGPHLPESDVGLLFMAYNRKIADQFKFTQRAWANSDRFPLGKPNVANGIDPVIGQAGAVGSQQLPVEWDNPAMGTDNSATFAGFVKMKGGEYFFSPSLTFLKAL
jgi:Dyp-type peroxidase family